MKNTKGRSRTFYRYILSYALVLFLPIAVLFTLFGSFLADRYNQEIADSSTRLLTQMQENLDTQLEQLVNISFMIQNNAVVNLRTNEGDVVAARKAVDTLNVLHSVSSLPEYLITYRSGTEYCFTSSSRIRPEKLFTNQLVYQNHTLEDFLATVDRPESIVTWPADTVRQYGGQETEYITLFISVSAGVKTRGKAPPLLRPFLRRRLGLYRPDPRPGHRGAPAEHAAAHDPDADRDLRPRRHRRLFPFQSALQAFEAPHRKGAQQQRFPARDFPPRQDR